MSDAISGKGAKFQRETASPGVYASVGESLVIDGPNVTRAMYEVTHTESPGGYDEFIPGTRAGGDLKASMNYTFAGYNTLKADIESDDPVNYQVVYADPGDSIRRFSAYVTSINKKAPAKGVITMEVGIKITGIVTIVS